MTLEHLAQERAVVRQLAGVLLTAELVEQTRRLFDVGEEECDCSCRKLVDSESEPQNRPLV
jgi:hypothetical protein